MDKLTKNQLEKSERALVKVECNLEEFPYFRLSKRDAKKLGKIEYQRQIRDKRGNFLKQSWIVRGSGELGLPGPFDQDVYVAILKILDKKGLRSTGGISFTRYEIRQILGLNHSGKIDRMIKDSLQRMVSTTVESKSAFYRKKVNEYLTDIFHLFDRVVIYDKEQRRTEEDEGTQLALELNAIYPSKWFLESIKAFYIKNLDATLFYSLNSPVAKRLYRFLDKKRYGGTKFEIGLIKLAEAIPIHQRYRYDIKRVLDKADRELIEKGFLKSAQFKHSKRDKEDKVVYRFSETAILQPKTAPEIPMATKNLRIKVLVQEMLNLLGDEKSKAFYTRVAKRCPEEMIYACLSETKDLALTGRIRKSKGACFTDLIKRNARQAGIDV